MFIASLIGIMTVKEAIDAGYEYFVRVRAMEEKRVLKDDDMVVVFNIVGTTSYQVFFLDKGLDEIKERLKEVGVKINYDSEKAILRYLEGLENERR
ncbi:DUF749 family protein [Methanocaldococcus sp.]